MIRDNLAQIVDIVKSLTPEQEVYTCGETGGCGTRFPSHVKNKDKWKSVIRSTERLSSHANVIKRLKAMTANNIPSIEEPMLNIWTCCFHTSSITFDESATSNLVELLNLLEEVGVYAGHVRAICHLAWGRPCYPGRGALTLVEPVTEEGALTLHTAGDISLVYA